MSRHRQITDTIMMIRPVAFHRNPQTDDNFYQHDLEGVSDKKVQERALEEFDQFVAKLREKGIRVVVAVDTPEPPSPDSIFPNNWISTHEDGTILLYPMYAPNRRVERRQSILELLKENFRVNQIDRSLTEWEEKHLFLEGTGSMILDRIHNVAYAALSERTHTEVLHAFAEMKSCRVIQFTANQTAEGMRVPIYHTNVMMCLGEEFALICLDSIDDPEERTLVTRSLEESGREIIPITEEQNNHFAGNMLQVLNEEDQPFVVMSEAAYNSLDDSQIDRLRQHGEIIYSNIDTIETLGGGSARCMMAEIFLPKN